jgi:UDP-glucose 4-epimerase
MRLLITGAAGYVGALLAERYAAMPEFDFILVTDQTNSRSRIKVQDTVRLKEETGRLQDPDFVQVLERHLPLDAVIHSAFAIRAGYGEDGQRREQANLDACRNVFELCFKHQVKKLIYISSAAVYGARPDNRADHLFTEKEPLREDIYPYGVQKRLSEELLQSLQREWQPDTKVAVVRPCSIIGPRFLAESTKKITLLSFLQGLLPVIPELSTEWARQYLHEEDLVAAIRHLLLIDRETDFDVFNLAPADYLRASQIAETLGKRTAHLPAWLVRAGFAVLWHTTRGRIPTARGSVNFFRYPVNLDGSKITRLGFQYRHGSREALLSV